MANAYGTLCVTVMNECWAGEYMARPTFADVVNKVGSAWEWDGVGMASQRTETTDDDQMRKAMEEEHARKMEEAMKQKEKEMEEQMKQKMKEMEAKMKEDMFKRLKEENCVSKLK